MITWKVSGRKWGIEELSQNVPGVPEEITDI
jgi:hypothetical protein